MSSLSVIIPAYNEEENIELTVNGLVSTLKKRDLDWQIIIVDDGSKDRTRELAEKIALGSDNIAVLHNQNNSGIGCCFSQGLDKADKEIVTWIPADGENDINELIKYFSLLEHVDIIIPFVANLNVRSRIRRLLSAIYLWIINISFGTMFHYTNGNVVYKRKVFENFKIKSSGFFFQTESLIKAARSGFIFAEVPVRLGLRKNGLSKALTFSSLIRIVNDFLVFFLDVHIFRTSGRTQRN